MVNRVHHDLLGGAEVDDVSDELAAELGRQAREAASPTTSATTTCSPAATPTTSSASASSCATTVILLVPYLDEDVHDIEGLAHLDRYLFATEAQRRKLLDNHLRAS